MLSLIFLLLAGAAIAFVSLQNTGEISLTFLTYTFDRLPVPFVILGSVLVGVMLAYIISFINSISTLIVIRSQHKKIGQEKKEVAQLTKRVHQLEIENVSLRNKTELRISDLDSDQKAL